MDSALMQSPVDPDATFRTKAGKQHRGYTANVEESVGANGSIITDYQFDSNNKSDSEFLKEHLEHIGHQDEETTIVADGAYSGDENVNAAADQNIKLVTTDLLGKDVDPIMGAFQFSEDGTKVLQCPAGNVPKTNWYNKQSGQVNVSFPRECCAGCPYQQNCHPKIFKRVSKLTVSNKMKNRAIIQRRMQTDEFKMLARLRNGVETVPSLLKNQFNVNKMRVHGLIRCKFNFGSKIAALNFRKLFRFRMGSGHYAPNPVLA
jgi:hypothetical protein